MLAETEEAQICILRNMYALWKNHYQMMVVLTDKFLKTGIIECSAIANWIFSKEMASEFTKFVLLCLNKILIHLFNFEISQLWINIKKCQYKKLPFPGYIFGKYCI